MKGKRVRAWSKAPQETVLHTSFAKHLTALPKTILRAFCIPVSSLGVGNMWHANWNGPSFVDLEDR